MMPLSQSLVLWTGLVCALTALAGEPGLVARNPHKQLVLDTRIIQSTNGAVLKFGPVEKESRNPLFRADKPWENALNNLYPNVHFDEQEGLFKLWYKCVLNEPDVIAKLANPTTIHGQGWLLLYATSQDGLVWRKPELGLVTFDGSTQNNAVARDTPNAGVFKDVHETNPARRYKMIYDVGRGQMRARFSPDGLRWDEPHPLSGLTDRTGDTHNNAFWDERLGRYVLLSRFFIGERLVARAHSADFLSWEDPRLVLQSSPQEGKARQTYCMPAFPYANVYLGYLMMYNAGSDQTVDCELAWSADSVVWQRLNPGTPFLPRGPAGSCDSQCIYAPAGPPMAQEGKLLIFYGGSDFPHKGWKRHCLPCLARLRLDGFAGYEPVAPDSRAGVVTQPLLATGEPLRISADARGGMLRVAVLDAPAFATEPSLAITNNVTDGLVQWPGRAFASLKGQRVRLRFELERARLYAFSGLGLP